MRRWLSQISLLIVFSMFFSNSPVSFYAGQLEGLSMERFSADMDLTISSSSNLGNRKEEDIDDYISTISVKSSPSDARVKSKTALSGGVQIARSNSISSNAVGEDDFWYTVREDGGGNDQGM